MRVLVTGGAGFLGPHVVTQLRTAGHDVVVLDQREPPVQAEFVRGDLTSLDDCTRAAVGVDGICHLGAIGDVYVAMERPYLAAAVNVHGTANIMEAALRAGVRKVVYTSTWEVYGRPRYEPIDEDHPCDPDHPYNITKLAGERLALAYDHLKGVPTLALRLGTAYGTGMRPNSVFSIFFNKALQGDPIIIQGDGQQYRQFTHVSDIARAFLLGLESDVHGIPLNVVAEEATSIRRLAEMVAEIFPTVIERQPARAGDITSARVSSAAAQRVLKWKAAMTMREGLDDLAQTYRAP